MHGLIPLPTQLTERSGHVVLPVKPSIAAPGELEAERGVLAVWLENALSGSPSSRGADKAQFNKAPVNREPAVKAPGPVVRLELDSTLGKSEAYTLSIGPDAVLLRGSDAAGILRGAATLYQLALSEGRELPCLDIYDEPRFSWRGFMLDTARAFYRVGFLERLIDLAAIHKLNVFHWHLSDDQAWRLDIPGMPELAAYGSRRLDRRFNAIQYREGFYTPADVRRIVAYAAARHIEVVPEIDVPGHSSALLASHPELWCNAGHSDRRFEPEDRFGVFDGILCAGNNDSYNLLTKVFAYLAEVFPSGYVHAGGDEVPKATWLSCDHCRATMKEENLRDQGGAFDPERLQAFFMDRVAKSLAGLGRRMVGWDEVVDGACSKDVLVMAWRSQEHGYEAAAKGYDVVMCPQTKACYLDHKHLDQFEEPGQLGVCTVKDSYTFDPAPRTLPESSRAHIKGGQANLWGELMYFGRQAEYMLYPRLCAISEALWTPAANKDFVGFSKRLETHGRRLDTLGVNRYRGLLEP